MIHGALPRRQPLDLTHRWAFCACALMSTMQWPVGSVHTIVKGGRAPKAPSDTAIIRPKAARLHFTSPEHD